MLMMLNFVLHLPSVIVKDEVMVVLDYFFSVDSFVEQLINVNIEVFLLFVLQKKNQNFLFI
jgi:hypothetical protein